MNVTLRSIPTEAPRSVARQRLAEAISALEAARDQERQLRIAQGSAGSIETRAAAAVQAAKRALDKSAADLAEQLKQAATSGAEPPEVATDDGAAAALAKAEAQLASAQTAKRALCDDLEAAKAVTTERVRDVDLATQGVFTAEAEKLIAEGLAAMATLDAIRAEVWALDRTGGHVGAAVGASGGYRPFPLSANGLRLLFGFNPAVAQMQAELNRWRRYRMALRANANAQLGDDPPEPPDDAA